MDNALGISTDNTCDEGVDDEGDMDEQDGITLNPKARRFV